MNSSDVDKLLIDYAEGILTPEQKIKLEELLYVSPEMRNDLKLIQFAMTELRSVSGEKVPEHYFTNFLPRLREKIDTKIQYQYKFIPFWAKTIISPMMVIMLVVSLFSLYQILKPEHYVSPLYSVVKDMDVSDLDEAFHNTANFETEATLVPAGEANYKNQLTEKKLTKAVMNTDMLGLNQRYENIINDRQIIAQLDESEIETIVERLNLVQ